MFALNCIKLFIISAILNVILVQCDVFVSLRSGKDTTSCGTQASPCLTISYASHQVSAGSIIYLDGLGTSWQRTYTCQPLKSEHQGIYLTKNMSFISSGSRAFIACSHGNFWIVDGSKSKRGIQINFQGLAFRNSSFEFLDASVNIKDCMFRETKLLTLNFSTIKLNWFELTLDNVLFQQNTECMAMESNNKTEGSILIKIKDSVFESNGDIKKSSRLSSILWLNGSNDDINIEIKNVSFENNSLSKNGMIYVKNELGRTNISLTEVRLVENGHHNMSNPNSLFLFKVSNMVLKIEFCHVTRSVCRLLQLAAHTVQMSVINTKVEDFIIPHSGGGVFAIDAIDKCNISFINSYFRNCKSLRGESRRGGVLYVLAASLTVVRIQNSTIQNVSNRNRHSYGGALCIELEQHHSPDVNVSLNILNSSFLDNLSRLGGAIAVIGKVSLFVLNSIFTRNKALDEGGSLYLNLSVNSTIILQSVSFIENNANNRGGAIRFVFNVTVPYTSSFVATNVDFIRNKNGAIVMESPGNLRILLIQVRFVKNTGVNLVGSAIVIKGMPKYVLVHLVLSKCVFRENYGFYGVISLEGYGRCETNCQNSTFSSNSTRFRCGLSLEMEDSMVKVSNSIFVNNSCQDGDGAAITMDAINSNTTITDSIFINNTALRSTGGAVFVFVSKDKTKTTFFRDSYLHSWSYSTSVEFQRVHFQGNIARNGNAVFITGGRAILRDCLFLDNFGLASGSQLVTSGSARLNIYNSSFKETIGKILLNKKEFVFTSFLGVYSSGPYVVRNSTFDQTITSNEPLIVVSKTGSVNFDNISIITCPSGASLIKSNESYVTYNPSGRTVTVTVIRLFCQRCNPNFYSLQIGRSKGLNVDKGFLCTRCPYGAECFTGINSKDNFWGYKSGSHPPTLAFTRCPTDYCKSPEPSSDAYNACERKRTGVMCGTCSHGYTETLLSTHCKLIKDCKRRWFWIAFVAFVCLTAILLIFKPPVIRFLVTQVLWFKKLSRRCSANSRAGNIIQDLSSHEVQHEDRQHSYFVEIVMYFYQISQLFHSSLSSEEYSETKVLPSLFSFSNFQFTISENACPFSGLMPHTKKLFKIVPILATMTVIYIMYAFHCLLSRVRRTQAPSLAPYLQASVRTLFLSYTVLATTSIQLIRCVSIDDDTRWFYNGNVACYQWWQYAAFLFNAIFVIPFIFVLAWASFKLHKEAITVRQLLFGFILPLPSLLYWLFFVIFPAGRNNAEPSENLIVLKKMLLTSFRQPGALYWKSVLIARRFILVLLFCVITDTSFKLFWMTLVCLLALFHHLRVRPFKHNWANNLESISLLCLVVLGFINQYKSVLVEAGVPSSTDSFKVIRWLEIVILGIFPACIFLIFSFAIISLFVRFLYVSFGSLFRRLFRPNANDQARLLDICENVY